MDNPASQQRRAWIEKGVGRLAHGTPFFYGWTILSAAGASMFFRNALGSLTLAVFVYPISQDLGWSRTLIGGAASLGGLLSIIRYRRTSGGLGGGQVWCPPSAYVGTSRVLDLLKTRDLSKVIETSFGQMAIGDFMMFPTLVIVIHR